MSVIAVKTAHTDSRPHPTEISATSRTQEDRRVKDVANLNTMVIQVARPPAAPSTMSSSEVRATLLSLKKGG